MAGIGYSDLVDRLTPEARSLFREMVLAHLEAGPGDRLFIRSDTNAGTGLHFRGGRVSRTWQNFDGGAIQDLIGYSLLHVDYGRRGTPNYRISGEGLAFFRWRMERDGTPVAQTEEAVQRALAGPEFAADHPQAAHHLREAFDLLWSDRTDNQAGSEIGDHLRKALMDLTSDVAGDNGGDQEKPIKRLERFVDTVADKITERETAVLRALAELARTVLRLDHRLNHIRDETDQCHPLRSWDEARRACFATAYTCFEFHRASDALSGQRG